MDSLDWIEHLAPPTCILSGHGTILATNGSARRLLGPNAPQSGYAKGLIGLSLPALGLGLVPISRPFYRDWASLLEDLASRAPLQTHNGATRDSHPHSEDASSVFWETERLSEVTTEIDCLIGRPLDAYTQQRAQEDRRARSQTAAREDLRTPYVKSRLQICMRHTSSQELVFILHFFQHSVYGLPSSNDKTEEWSQTSVALSASLATQMSSTMEVPKLENSRKFIPYICGHADIDGQMLFLSPSWYQYTGLTEAESLGTAWATVVHPDDLLPLSAAWGEVIKTKPQSWAYDGARVRRYDGEYRYFLIRVESQKDEHGNHLGYYASQVELHDLILSRRKTERQRQSVLAAINTAELSLWEFDTSLNISLLAGSLNLDLSTFVDLDRLQNRDVVHTNAPIDNLTMAILDVSQGQPRDHFNEHQAAGRIYRTWLVPHVDDDDVQDQTTKQYDRLNTRAVRGLTIDVTDVRARAELEIENAKLASEERAARKASELKSNFLATMSHEIRTPIAGIIGLNDLLSTTNLDMEQAQLCKDLKHSAEYLLTIINDILDFGKLDSGHLKIESIPFEVYSSVRDMQTFAIQADSKGLKLDLSCDMPMNKMVIGDPHRLRQVLTNLISNSMKFTKSGSVSLKIRQKAPAENDVTMSDDGNSNKDTIIVEYVVSDTGIGIEAQTLKTLFRPFKQADSSTARIYGGTGLGLSICKQLVELMGGTLKLESVPGQGSTATVRLPYGIPTDERAPPEPLPSNRQGSVEPIHPQALSPAQRKATNVLIVEDNPINQKIALALVRQLGFTASAVWNGAEALDHLARTPSADNPSPDIVLCDCMMPEMDGYEATRRLRNDTTRFNHKVRNLPVIALTASAVQGDREKCLSAGMDDYMVKPLGRVALEDMLLKYCRQGELRHKTDSLMS